MLDLASEGGKYRTLKKRSPSPPRLNLLIKLAISSEPACEFLRIFRGFAAFKQHGFMGRDSLARESSQ
jgi:hypothetical protein